MRLACSSKMVRIRGHLSRQKLAEIAGLTRADFINALSRFKVSPFQYTPEELRSELNDAH